MSYTTSTAASFALAAGQVFAVRTQRSEAARIDVYGASDTDQIVVPDSSARQFGPYPEAKTVVVRALYGTVEYDFGATANLPAYVYSTPEVESIGGGVTGLGVDPASGRGTAGLLPATDAAYTFAIMGDSLAQNHWTTQTNLIAVNANGPLTWLNALYGNSFNVVANVGRGGKTAYEVYDEQLAPVRASAARHVMTSFGHNDIFNFGRTGAQTASKAQDIFKALLDNGQQPWNMIMCARSFSSTALLREMRDYHYRMVDWFTANPGVIWIDGYAMSVDASTTPAQPTIKSGWTFDSGPFLHWNQVPAYWMGKAFAQAAATRIPRRFRLIAGGDDFTLQPSLNLLDNVVFSGSGGTAGANISGTVPANWSVSWATRTGTGVATVSVVDVFLADRPGVSVGKGLKVEITSGATAAGDAIVVTNTNGLTSRLVGGNQVFVQGMVTVEGLANVEQIRLRCQTNTTESTWWGSHLPATGSGTLGVLPESTVQLACESRPGPVNGTAGAAPSQAMYEFRLNFGGAASSGSATLSHPRLAKAA